MYQFTEDSGRRVVIHFTGQCAARTVADGRWRCGQSRVSIAPSATYERMCGRRHEHASCRRAARYLHRGSPPLHFRLLSGTPLNQFLRISLRRERSFFTNANFPTQLALLPVHRKAERTRVAPRLLPPYSATPSSRRERVSLRPGIRPSLCSSLHANSYTRYLLSIYRYSLHGGLELAGA